ncbi:hypothetical protein A0H81_06302 [Grifola frondosa]|uniref:Uncharacterized protein n=1 Tax=Grifola frondosa TaxID=5627 RepID=A0A1C7MBA9_GRIFR|nr:hypothetical protein A0H81_06302 [Grifola frondosa]
MCGRIPDARVIKFLRRKHFESNSEDDESELIVEEKRAKCRLEAATTDLGMSMSSRNIRARVSPVHGLESWAS